MLYHLTLTLTCGHPIEDLGDADLTSLSTLPDELRERALSIMREKGFNHAYIECRKAPANTVSRRFGVFDWSFEFPFPEKPQNPDSSRPSIENTPLTANIRSALWRHAHVFYLDELSGWHREHVGNIRGLGPKFLSELEDRLGELGIRFKGENY